MPLSCEKNNVSDFSQLPLIESLSNLQVMRTGIKTRMSSNLGRIGLFTLSYSPLSTEIFSHRLILKEINAFFYRKMYIPSGKTLESHLMEGTYNK